MFFIALFVRYTQSYQALSSLNNQNRKKIIVKLTIKVILPKYQTQKKYSVPYIDLPNQF